MALNFPSNPEVDDTYTLSNSSWQWDGVAWNIIFGQGAALATQDLTNVPVNAFRAKSVASGLSTVVYNVTITGPQAPDTVNKYVLNGVYRPTLNFVVGYTYVFDQSDDTNVYWPNDTGTTANPHPINFSADNLSGERGGGTSYTTNVSYFLDNELVTQTVYYSTAFNTATERRVHITVTNDTPSTLYYWCWNHAAMGNEIVVIDPGTQSASLSLAGGTGISITESQGVSVIANTGVTAIVAGTGITTEVDQGTVTINAAAELGNVYENAIATLRVDNIGTTAYTFPDHYTGNNPTIFALAGATIAFDLTEIPSLPFEIQNSAGQPYSIGLIHVDPNGTVSQGTAAQGKSSGTLYWRINESVSGTFRYQCQTQAPMVGAITVKRLSVI